MDLERDLFRSHRSRAHRASSRTVPGRRSVNPLNLPSITSSEESKIFLVSTYFSVHRTPSCVPVALLILTTRGYPVSLTPSRVGTLRNTRRSVVTTSMNPRPVRFNGLTPFPCVKIQFHLWVSVLPLRAPSRFLSSSRVDTELTSVTDDSEVLVSCPPCLHPDPATT